MLALMVHEVERSLAAALTIAAQHLLPLAGQVRMEGPLIGEDGINHLHDMLLVMCAAVDPTCLWSDFHLLPRQ